MVNGVITTLGTATVLFFGGMRVLDENGRAKLARGAATLSRVRAARN